MKKQMYRLMGVLGIFFGLAVAGAQAQAPSKVQVTIRFEFSAGKTTLQPGVYSIKRMSGNLLSFSSADGKSAVILNAPVTHTSGDPEAVERLVFTKSGERYFLSQIWLTADSGREVWRQRKADKSERIEIALRAK